MDTRVLNWLPDNFVEESYESDEITLQDLERIVEEEVQRFLIEEGEKADKFKSGLKTAAGVAGRSAKRIGKNAAGI